MFTYQLHRNGKYFQIAWKDSRGKRHRKSIGKVSRKEAEAIMQQMIAEHASNPATRDITCNPNLVEWIERYLELVQPELANSTVMLHRRTCSLLKEYFAVDMKLQDISSSAMSDWRLWLGRADRKPKVFQENTICKHSRTVKVIFERAINEGLLAKNNCRHLKSVAPAKSQSQMRFVSEEEVLAVARVAPELEPLLMLCFYAGLRTGEALHLKYGDVYPKERKIRLRSRAGVDNSKQHDRDVLICQELYNWGDLWDRRRMLLANKNQLADTVGNHLFQQELKDMTVCGIVEANRKDMVSVNLRKACKVAGLENPFVFTDLRRTRSTIWFSDFPEHVAKAWMGHDLKTAIKHYLSVPKKFYEADEEEPQKPMCHKPTTAPAGAEAVIATIGHSSGPYWTCRSPLSRTIKFRISHKGASA